MSDPGNGGQAMTVEQFTDALIRVAIVALLVIAALQVFSPFMDLMLWALIIAITIYPGHQKLAARLGGSQSKAATFIVLLGVMILGVPVILIGALGGMVSAGFIGLFTGAVILAVGYQIFMQWVAMKSEEDGAAEAAAVDTGAAEGAE